MLWFAPVLPLLGLYFAVSKGVDVVLARQEIARNPETRTFEVAVTKGEYEAWSPEQRAAVAAIVKRGEQVALLRSAGLTATPDEPPNTV